MGTALGGGGAKTMFLDLEARREFGRGWSAGLTARRGWTSFAAGNFQTGAYGFDVAKRGVLGDSDRDRLPARPAATGRKGRLRHAVADGL